MSESYLTSFASLHSLEKILEAILAAKHTEDAFQRVLKELHSIHSAKNIQLALWSGNGTDVIFESSMGNACLMGRPVRCHYESASCWKKDGKLLPYVHISDGPKVLTYRGNEILNMPITSVKGTICCCYSTSLPGDSVLSIMTHGPANGGFYNVKEDMNLLASSALMLKLAMRTGTISPKKPWKGGTGSAWPDREASVEEILFKRLKDASTLLASGASPERGVFQRIMSLVEKGLIQWAMEKTGCIQFRAAELLGINRNTLRAKLKQYNITKTAKTKKGRRAK